MIDVIIPAYNAHETILKTLLSIEIQTIAKEINVYIIDDASDKDYEQIKNMFKDTLNIKIIRIEKNEGPGVARQVGIDNSDGEYIIFLDADDIFYDIHSVENLYKGIQKYDGVVGLVEEQLNKDETTILKGKEEDLHGKMYRRSILKKHNIKFYPVRNHEDNVFNLLYSDCCQALNFIDKKIYVYRNTENSITNNTYIEEKLGSFIDIYSKFIEDEINRNIEKEKISVHIYVAILYVYFNYFFYKEAKLDFVFTKMKHIKRFYKENDILNEEEKKQLYGNFWYDVIPDMSVEKFLEKIKEE